MRCRSVPGGNNDPKKLILAAADFAEGDNTEPPPELFLAWQVEQWGAEAVFGTVVPARLLMRMSASVNVYNAFTNYIAGSHQAAEWARSHPAQLRIVQSVREMRQQNA